MATVCVTGASGFIASWLVKRLLEAGYYVRGTVRDPENDGKVNHLWKLPFAKERLKLMKADLMDEGVFDSIVEGCHGVFHVAAAVKFVADVDPQHEIIEPSVFGTLNVLKACKKSSTVKRVVITSSTATVGYPETMPPDGILDESVWSSIEVCREKKMWYPLGKTIAEREAWKFAQANNMELVTILPCLVVGYVLPDEPTVSGVEILQILKGEPRLIKLFMEISVVHLDDVASAHICAYENPKATGRYLCTAVDTTTGDIGKYLATRYPEFNSFTEFDVVERRLSHSRKKIEDELGIKFKSMDEMFDDCIQSFLDKKLLNQKEVH